MKLVIDIDEHEYNKALNGNFNVTAFSEAVRKHSIPLPKGHGRLIDGDALKDQMKIGYKIVENAPTIIEADKDCTDCILDGTDACPRGAGRAVDAEVCEDFIGESEGENERF